MAHKGRRIGSEDVDQGSDAGSQPSATTGSNQDCLLLREAIALVWVMIRSIRRKGRAREFPRFISNQPERIHSLGNVSINIKHGFNGIQ
mmetsp:Transcript_8088/g.24280  ORF Transcript_8088/g.24280 Transcript_8088/m.24280 type:complete len:89 (+) Transcript_8088:134-400(+)